MLANTRLELARGQVGENCVCDPMNFDLTFAIEVLHRSPTTLRALLDGLERAVAPPDD